jgi:hypothetical protein
VRDSALNGASCNRTRLIFQELITCQWHGTGTRQNIDAACPPGGRERAAYCSPSSVTSSQYTLTFTKSG